MFWGPFLQNLGSFLLIDVYVLSTGHSYRLVYISCPQVIWIKTSTLCRNLSKKKGTGTCCMEGAWYVLYVTSTCRSTQSLSLTCKFIMYLWFPVVPELSSSFFLFLPLPSPPPPTSPPPPEWEDEGCVEEEEGGSRLAPSDWSWLAVPRLERRKSRSSSSTWGKTHTQAHHSSSNCMMTDHNLCNNQKCYEQLRAGFVHASYKHHAHICTL